MQAADEDARAAQGMKIFQGLQSLQRLQIAGAPAALLMLVLRCNAHVRPHPIRFGHIRKSRKR